MSAPESFPWLSAGLAVLALALGAPGLTALVRGRRSGESLLPEFPSLPCGDAAVRAEDPREWRGVWDGCPGAWPADDPARVTLPGIPGEAAEDRPETPGRSGRGGAAPAAPESARRLLPGRTTPAGEA